MLFGNNRHNCVFGNNMHNCVFGTGYEGVIFKNNDINEYENKKLKNHEMESLKPFSSTMV